MGGGGRKRQGSSWEIAYLRPLLTEKSGISTPSCAFKDNLNFNACSHADLCTCECEFRLFACFAFL